MSLGELSHIFIQTTYIIKQTFPSSFAIYNKQQDVHIHFAIAISLITSGTSI